MSSRIARARPALAAALFCLLVLAGAVAAASGGSSGPTANASGLKKQVKQLKLQLAALEQKVNQLQTQPGPPGADGSAVTPEQILSGLQTVDGPGSGVDADVLDGQDASAFVREGDNAGGDASGPFSNLQLVRGSVGRQELASGGGNSVISFFGFSVPANACTLKVFSYSDADLGEVLIAYPEGDLGDGIYVRPNVVGHPGQGIIEICNSTGSTVNIPDFPFFQLRLIG
jgi:outer membrane murein-binding lipoprotein Lpp